LRDSWLWPFKSKSPCSMQKLCSACTGHRNCFCFACFNLHEIRLFRIRRRQPWRARAPGGSKPHPARPSSTHPLSLCHASRVLRGPVSIQKKKNGRCFAGNFQKKRGAVAFRCPQRLSGHLLPWLPGGSAGRKPKLCPCSSHTRCFLPGIRPCLCALPRV
jgi:hypothetical protein